MDIPNISEIGVGGIFALLVMKLVFDFLKNRKEERQHKDNNCIPPKEWNTFYIQWHEHYNDRKLLDVIEQLSDNIAEQTKVLSMIATEGKINSEALKRISLDIHEMRQ